MRSRYTIPNRKSQNDELVWNHHLSLSLPHSVHQSPTTVKCGMQFSHECHSFSLESIRKWTKSIFRVAATTTKIHFSTDAMSERGKSRTVKNAKLCLSRSVNKPFFLWLEMCVCVWWAESNVSSAFLICCVCLPMIIMWMVSELDLCMLFFAK